MLLKSVTGKHVYGDLHILQKNCLAFLIANLCHPFRLCLMDKYRQRYSFVTESAEVRLVESGDSCLQASDPRASQGVHLDVGVLLP